MSEITEKLDEAKEKSQDHRVDMMLMPLASESSIAIGLLVDVTLGKMLQPSQKKSTDVLKPYLRAAHVQPGGVIGADVETKKMWFTEAEAGTLDLRAGDTVVVEGGAGFGRSAYLPHDLPGWGFQNSIVRLRGTTDDCRYLMYALQSALESGAIHIACNAATFAHFTAEKVESFRVPYHQPEKRRRIADHLDRETGEIDAMIGKLGELEAELVERKREVAANALLPYGVPGDPTSLDGFEELGYTNIASIGVLVDRRQERNTDQHAQYLSLMKGAGVIRYEDKGDVGNKKPEDLTRTIRVKSGDYLVNSMNFYIGSYGRSSYDGVCSSVYLVFSPNEELVIGDFFKYFFANDELRDRIQDLGHGILEHRRGIVWDRFSAVKVPLPPLEEQRRIADHLDEVTSKIDAMLAKVAELKDLLAERRAALITDVVTGRKDVA